LGRRLSISLGEYAAVFQAEIYAILPCAYEIQMNNRPEKYVFYLIGSFESSAGCQDDVLVSATVPKGIEQHFHPPYCGTLLGTQTFWDMWKSNCQWARCSLVCWTGTGLWVP
jgi:hypothetical protein